MVTPYASASRRSEAIEAPDPPRSSAEMNEMESPVACDTSLSVLCARVRSRRSRSPIAFGDPAKPLS
jgi:hypothetical protein